MVALFTLPLLLILFYPLPSPLFPKKYATLLQSSDGQLLGARISSDGQWRFPPADSVPQKFEAAILLFEDEYFHYHPGINPVSLGRAVWQNIRSGKIVSGGSTLTMQTVRMALENQERTYSQKIWELLLSIKLELFYSKEEILQLYTYHAPFGGNVVGLSAASWRYFGRPPYQLSWAETAALAVLPNSPSSVFPGKNEITFRHKRDALLDKLSAKGCLTSDEALLAKAEPLPGKVKPLPNDAFHLLQRAEKDGLAGTIVQSTLDFALQRHVKEKTDRYSEQLAYNEIHNAAAIVIDIASGETLAYVGNSFPNGDETNNHGQFVDVITARRSPGSLLKPFLYAAALDDGILLPKELLPDIPLFYRGFAPQNFDKKYRGAVAADEALASSLNVPFVFLLREYGYEKLHQKLQQIGMRSLDKPANHYGLSLILGGAESTLWELSGMFAGMARALNNFQDRPYNKGYSTADYRPNSYLPLKTTKQEGGLETNGFLAAPSILYAFQAMQQLRRPEEMSGAEMYGSYRPVAWKTGTSHGFRDAWAIGLNDRYLVGVWVGNADSEGRPGLTGIRSASPLMFSIFELLDGDATFDEPFGKMVSICKESGLLAGEYCTETTDSNLPDYMLQGKRCTYHHLLHLDQAEKHQVSSACYAVNKMHSKPWFVLPAVQAWYYKQYHSNYKEPPPFLPACGEQNANGFMELIYPREFTKVYVPVEQDGKPGLAIFEAAHRNPASTIYWHLDEAYVGSTNFIHQMGFHPEPGPHMLTLVDEEGNELKQGFEVLR
ncbi:MAG: penicillin-binding protein 1C [Imperialibacter sp.]|uniref:penicillin-binding protein 1C n=1 Tax=Imperialibacter sp. TaxID=2038411 RepID=UPI0032EE0A2A